MISQNAYIGMIAMIIFGIALPIAVIIWWLKTHKEKFTTVVVGALTFIIFAVILESFPKALLFNPATQIGNVVMNNAALFTICGALFAGLFEETGRLVMFKTLLKKCKNRETAISHGIGHGGCEAVIVLAVSGIQLLIYAAMINSGSFQEIINETAALGVDVSSLEAVPEMVASVTTGSACMALIERAIAMTLHVGLSIMVFYAARDSKTYLYISAIILHTLFDVPAALYQFGIPINIYLLEAFMLVFAIVLFAITYKRLYKPDITPNTNLMEE